MLRGHSQLVESFVWLVPPARIDRLIGAWQFFVRGVIYLVIPVSVRTLKKKREEEKKRKEKSEKRKREKERKRDQENKRTREKEKKRKREREEQIEKKITKPKNSTRRIITS